MSDLTHLDKHGRARMVDVSMKAETVREAKAEGRVVMSEAARTAAADADFKKGDVRAAAEIAGVMAAKRTAELIPLCHTLLLDQVRVEIAPTTDGLHVEAAVKTTGRTGVEMEALTAVSVACLTIYDMLKSVDRAMRIEGVRLIAKSGGKGGEYRADAAPSSDGDS